MSNKVLMYKARNWGYGGYALEEHTATSINVIKLASERDIKPFMLKAIKVATEMGVPLKLELEVAPQTGA